MSCEHLAIRPQRVDVRLPVNPSRSRFTIKRCRALMETSANFGPEPGFVHDFTECTFGMLD